MKHKFFAFASIGLIAAAALAACTQTRMDAGKALVTGEAGVTATATAATANAPAMTPAQRAAAKAALDAANQGIVAAHSAYDATAPQTPPH